MDELLKALPPITGTAAVLLPFFVSSPPLNYPSKRLRIPFAVLAVSWIWVGYLTVIAAADAYFYHSFFTLGLFLLGATLLLAVFLVSSNPSPTRASPVRITLYLLAIAMLSGGFATLLPAAADPRLLVLVNGCANSTSVIRTIDNDAWEEVTVRGSPWPFRERGFYLSGRPSVDHGLWVKCDVIVTGNLAIVAPSARGRISLYDTKRR